MDLRIGPMSEGDWSAACAIYRQGIDAGDATFETEVPTWSDWDCRHLAAGRVAARSAGRLVGWAALSPVSSRAAYRGVAEVSVCVATDARGQGVGGALLWALVDAAERAGIWTLQASVFPENAASLALHEGCGFRLVGRRERIGQLHGRWRDVILMERRSTIVGVSP